MAVGGALIAKNPASAKLDERSASSATTATMPRLSILQRLEIGDYVGTIRFGRKPLEVHFHAVQRTARIEQIEAEFLDRPGLARVFERVRILKALDHAGLAANDTIKARADLIYADVNRVA